MRKKHIVAWVVGAVLALRTAAVAATVTLTVSGIATQATATGSSCQTTALTATFTTPSWDNTNNYYKYPSVTIDGIDAACLGGAHRVYLSVTDSSGTRIGGSYSVATPSSGTSVSITGTDGDWPVATTVGATVVIK